MAMFDSEPWLQGLDRRNLSCDKFLKSRFVLHISGKEKKKLQIFVCAAVSAPEITATPF